jgi:hypothetical protein
VKEASDQRGDQNSKRFFKKFYAKKKTVTSSGEKVQVQRENTNKRKGPKKKKEYGSC